MLTMLAAVAEPERESLEARQLAGLERTLAEKTASINATAERFGVPVASVKRACSNH